MERMITGLALMGVLVPSLCEAAERYAYPQTTIRSQSSSTYSTASFGRFTTSSSASESQTSLRRGVYSGSLLPKTQEVEVAKNDCGPSAFQVLNAGKGEGVCVGGSPRR